MKKAFIILLNLFIVFTLLYAGFILYYPFMHFENLEETPMNIWIMDNTVPDFRYREHTGLLWLLNSLKIYNEKTEAAFNYEEDYYGFFPVNEFEYEIKKFPNQVEHPDLIYLADCYGVYVDDYFKENLLGTKSDIIYGGLKADDLARLKENLGYGNTLIGEFNAAGYPTEKPVADELGELFRMKWTGWTGRYFNDLSEGVEVPVWAVEFYEETTGLEWEFTGQGFLLVYEFDEIHVFEKGKDFGNDYIYMTFFEEYEDEFDITGDIRYEYWFEFAEALDSAEVLAEFTFDVTEQGERRLAELGLTNVFPAVVRNQTPLYTSYYFAGDFADGDIDYKLWDFYGFSDFKQIFPMSERGDNRKFFWRCYIPMMEKIMDDIQIQMALNTFDKYVGDLEYNAKAEDKVFKVKTEAGFEEIFIQGVNIGSSTPGKWFTEFPTTETEYLEWFEQISDMNANTIRVYTLMKPAFYNALLHYNQNNPENQLWLYQEIWPEEEPESGDYLREGYVEEYFQEIRYVISAVNGDINIPNRVGRASGVYTSDVSEYILGYLVGRELEPLEVKSTDELNEDFSYSGEYFFTSLDATPTEAWLAMCCDYAAKFETETYNRQHPIGIVNWPVLDPIDHDTEWHESGDKKSLYNDSVTLDINNINVNENLKTGFFGAYHIYPNYPDFINNEPHYADYMDEEGIFRYGGYLQEFMQTQTRYPALIAEFGLATGMHTAYISPDGFNHGGMTEKEQGEGIVRMMKTIERENYAGGLIFEWSDEWAKKTWNTQPFILPFDRNVLWHNIVDPEQNYGILAMETNSLKSDEYIIESDGELSEITLTMNEAYLYITVNLDRAIDFENEKLVIGLDTYDRNLGNFMFPYNNYQIAPFGMEFLVEISGYNDAYVLVDSGYNIALARYKSKKSYDGDFVHIIRRLNLEKITKSGDVIDEIHYDYSKLDFGDFDENSYNAWNTNGTQINIRIPWMILNFTDPSDMMVLDDEREIFEPAQEQLFASRTDGIMLYSAIFENEFGMELSSVSTEGMEPFKWEKWNVPSYSERLKDSYEIIAEYFGSR